MGRNNDGDCNTVPEWCGTPKFEDFSGKPEGPKRPTVYTEDPGTCGVESVCMTLGILTFQPI